MNIKNKKITNTFLPKSRDVLVIVLMSKECYNIKIIKKKEESYEGRSKQKANRSIWRMF